MKKYIHISLFFCLLITLIKAQDKKKEIINLKNLAINTSYSDFGASIYKDSLLYFASAHRTNKLINRRWKPNMQPFLNIYTSSIYDNNKDAKSKLGNLINTRNHESSIAFNSTYTEMYFTRNSDKRNKAKGKVKLKICKAFFKNGKWGNVEELPFNKETYSTGHPTLSEDQKTLYFISDMPGGFGETDIYSIQILPDGKYTEPKNLGPKVNTKGKEMFPFIDENNVLYFSSNGYKDSKGGLDIYYYKSNQEEAIALNAGKIINSASDDFAFSKLKNENKGYLSSNRKGGKGSDDIYQYSGNFIKFKEKCTVKIEVVVKDSFTKKLISNSFVSVSNNKNTDYLKFKTDHNGSIFFNENCRIQTYKISISKFKYKNEIRNINIDNMSKKVEVFLEKDLLKDKRISIINNEILMNIGNVYFDTNDYEIDAYASVILNKTISLMRDYPRIKVEIGSHTDSKGSDKFNLKLSENRAISTKKYMIDNGILEDRIIGKGYGETKLKNKCSNKVKCKDSEHQQNRRVEFKIIKY